MCFNDMGILDKAPEEFEYIDYRPELNKNLAKLAGRLTAAAIRTGLQGGFKTQNKQWKSSNAPAQPKPKIPKKLVPKVKKRRAPVSSKKNPAGAVPALKTAPLPKKGEQIVLAKEAAIKTPFTEKNLKVGLKSSTPQVTRSGSQASLKGKRASQTSLSKLMDDLNPPMAKTSQPDWVQARDMRKFGSYSSLPEKSKSLVSLGPKSKSLGSLSSKSKSLDSFHTAKGSLSSLGSKTKSSGSLSSKSLDSFHSAKSSLSSLGSGKKSNSSLWELKSASRKGSLHSIKKPKPPVMQIIKKKLAQYR